MNNAGTAVPAAITTGVPPPSSVKRRRMFGRFSKALDKRVLKRWPVLLIVLSWALMRWFGLSLPIGSALTWVLVIGAFVTLVIEFQKSGDITIKSFSIEVLFAVTAVYLTGAISFHLWYVKHTFFLVDLIVAALVLSDATISVINSFRTALRNFQAGIDTSAPDA